MNKKIKKKFLIFAVIFCFLIAISLVILFASQSFANELPNNAEVKADTDLTYYIKVTYDGKDKASVESNDSTIADVKSGFIRVTDKIPEGLIFSGFVTTEDGSIGAVRRSDSAPCTGNVYDDTHEESTEYGVWNQANTEYTYHGLHYNADTRTVTFSIDHMKAGCELTVGIITRTPQAIDDPNTNPVETRRDFYNYASAVEDAVSKISNTVHLFMGDDTTMYNVSYSYTGTVPADAPAAPATQSYAQNDVVGVAAPVDVRGYTFSGWTASGATVSNGKFTMPGNNVTLTGSFASKQSYTVSYTISGTTPSGYTKPSNKSYYEGDTVYLEGLKAGDEYNGYRFNGWTNNNVNISDDEMIMPASNVTLTGSFSPLTYKVSYEFYDGIKPTNSEDCLPDPGFYSSGDTVTLSNVKREPNGYKFLGWYSDSTFTMPAHDVVVYGEWKQTTGTFEPIIRKEILNPKTYVTGNVVELKITVENTANFPIHDVIVQELTNDVYFVESESYVIESEHYARIQEIPANSTYTVMAKYTIKSTDTGGLSNTVKLVGALADNGYTLYDKEYTATAYYAANVGTLPVYVPLTANKVLLNANEQLIKNAAVITIIQSGVTEQQNSDTVDTFIRSDNNVIKDNNYEYNFQFRIKDPNNTVIKTVTVTNSGVFDLGTIKFDKVGTYTIEEVQAHDLVDYENLVIQIEVTKDNVNGAYVAKIGNTIISGVDTTTYDGEAVPKPDLESVDIGKIINKVNTRRVQINKTNMSGTSISGAEFALYKKDEQASYLMVQPESFSNVFGKTINKALFESITTLDIVNVPSNAIEVWDVSNAQDKSVMAWYVDNDNDGKYELYIAQKGGVVANPNSSYLFAYYSNCNSIDLSNFSTSLVTNMMSMFYYNTRLEGINVSNFDTSNVTNMNYMFYKIGYDLNANSNITLDLSGFDTSQVVYMASMFEEGNHITNIYVSENWRVTQATYHQKMFSGCSRLPNYTNISVDKTKAHYDTGGYLTYRAAPASTAPQTVSISLDGGNTSFLASLVGTGTDYYLVPGTYYLKETKAPAGYKLKTDYIPMLVDGDGHVTVSGYTVTNGNSASLITIPNEEINMLPNTGGPGVYIYVFGGLVLIVGSIVGFIVFSRRTKDDDDDNGEDRKGG